MKNDLLLKLNSHYILCRKTIFELNFLSLASVTFTTIILPAVKSDLCDLSFLIHVFWFPSYYKNTNNNTSTVIQ